MNTAVMTVHWRRGFHRGVLAALACLALAVASLVVTLSIDAGAGLSGHVYEDVLTAVVWSAIAAVLLGKAPGNPFGMLALLVAASSAVAVAAGGYAQAADGSGWPAAAAAGWVGGWAWAVGTFVPVTLLPLWFPDGRPRDPRARIVGYAAGAGLLAIMVALAGDDRIELTPDHEVANPLRFAVSGVLFAAGSGLILASAVISLGLLVCRLTTATVERRRQIAPVAVALAVSLPALVLAAALPVWGPLIQVVTMPLVPVAVAVAVLHYRLYDIEVVLRRSLLFVALTGLVIAGYALVVQAAASVLHRRAGLPESLLATGVVALAFQPARLVLQRVIDRSLYGQRHAPGRALASVGEQLAGAADPDTALAVAIEQLKDALRLPWVAVSTPDAELTSTGPRPSWAVDAFVERIPLVHLGVGYGGLAVASRGPHDPLSPRDRRMLDQLAVPVAAVLAARRLIADLRLSRGRVVLAREEERRRLRRDLHDGLGPLLSAIVTHADVAAMRLERNPAGATDMVERLRSTSTDAIAALRRAVDGLRPAGVDELGLDGALRELFAALSVPERVEVKLRCPPLPTLPAAVELAGYRIASEAVTNALRHGRPRHVEIRITCESRALDVAVTDDGNGFDPAAAVPGIGLASMRERAEELGGRLDVHTGPTGTTVRAVLHLPSGDPPCE